MPEKLSEELKAMQDAQFKEFVSDTVAELHNLADRLERFANTATLPEVGFDTSTTALTGDEDNEKPRNP